MEMAKPLVVDLVIILSEVPLEFLRTYGSPKAVQPFE